MFRPQGRGDGCEERAQLGRRGMTGFGGGGTGRNHEDTGFGFTKGPLGDHVVALTKSGSADPGC